MLSRHFEKILEGAVLLLVVSTPIAYGSVHPWAYKLITSSAFLLLSLWFAKAWADGRFTYVRTGLFFFLPLSAFFFVLQLVPLPASVADALSPGSAAMRQAAGLGPGPFTLALYPWAAKDQAFLVLSVLLIFFLSISHLRSRQQITRVLYAVFVAAFLLVLIALTGRGREGIYQSGSFVNKNHFAGYMELVMPMAAAMLVLNVSAAKSGRGFKDQVIRILSMPAGTNAIIFAAFTALFCLAIFLSYSRGGVIGMCFSLVVLGAFTVRRRKLAIPVLAAVATLFAFVLLKTDNGLLLKRVGTLAEISKDESALTRYRIWQDTASVIKDFPAVGVGAGSFETAYPFYKTFEGERNVVQPESDYLYLLAECGILGFLVAAAFCAVFLRGVLSVFRMRDEPFAKSVAAGCLAGLAALSLHGMAETSLHMPAIMLLAAILMALAYSAAHARFIPQHDAGGPSLMAEKTVYLPAKWHVRLVMVLGVGLSASVSILSAAGAAGDLCYGSALRDKEAMSKTRGHKPKDYMRLADKFSMASHLDPGRSEYSFEEGRAFEWAGEYYAALERMGHGDPKARSRSFYEKALVLYRESSRLNPYASFPRLMAGGVLERGLGDRTGAKAEYMAAVRLNPTNKRFKVYVGRFFGR